MASNDSLRPAIVVLGVLLFVAGLAFAVRRWQQPPAQDERIEAAVDQMEQFTDELCACRDSICAQRVQERMSRWANDMAKENARTKPDKATQERMTKVGERMGACMQKALSSSSN